MLTHLLRWTLIQLFWSSLFPIAGYLVAFIITIFIEVPVFNANSIDPDQMSCSVASDLDLHLLPFTLLGVSRLK